MSWYRKIDTRMWGDAKFCDLSPNAKFLWVYLLTCPESTPLPGLLVGGPAHFTEAMELGWTTEAFLEVFRELYAKGMATACWKARLIWLPKAIKYNPPESPNVVLGWKKHWDKLPECELKNEAGRALRDFTEGMSQGFGEASRKVFREGYREGFGEGMPESGTGTGTLKNPPPPPLEQVTLRQKKSPERGCAAGGGILKDSAGDSSPKPRSKTQNVEKRSTKTETPAAIADDLGLSEDDVAQAKAEWQDEQAHQSKPTRNPEASFAAFLRRWSPPAASTCPAHVEFVPKTPPLTREELRESAEVAKRLMTEAGWFDEVDTGMPIAETRRASEAPGESNGSQDA